MNEHRPAPPVTYRHVLDRVARVVEAWATVAARAGDTAGDAAAAKTAAAENVSGQAGTGSDPGL